MPLSPVDQFDELPTIKGPKLGRFREGRYSKKIDYLELLSPGGSHGYVFKVRIDGELFALKIFRFFDVEEVLYGMGPAARSIVPRQDVEEQTDPFYAECRAYGRIASKPRKDPIAVACHGFISIPARQESFFAKKFSITDWNRSEEDLALPPTKREPFRALVKDLVEGTAEPTKELIWSMRRHLKALNSLRIWVMDVRWDNYKGGRLVDFSLAWTEPHFEFLREVNTAKEMDMNKGIDLADFDRMVKGELKIEDESLLARPKAWQGTLRKRPHRGQ